MKKIRATALLCTLVFAVAVFGFQYPSAQPNSGQMGASPSQQTTQPPQTTPPSQQQTPSTPSQQGQQPGQGQMPNVDNQVKTLSDQLNLTPDQQNKVRVVLVDQHEQAMGVVKDNNLSREDKLAKIHSLREGTIAKVRQILTDDQKPKFDQMIQQQDERIRQHEQGGANTPPGSSSPSSTPPASTAPSTTPPASNPPSNTPPPSNPPSSAKPPQ